MKTLKQFITESLEKLQTQVHFNPSASRLNALVSNSKSKSVRIAIDKDDNLWAGDAHHHIHVDLGDGNAYQNVQTHKMIGYIDQTDDGKNIVNLWVKGTSLTKKANHPKIDALYRNKNFISGHE